MQAESERPAAPSHTGSCDRLRGILTFEDMVLMSQGLIQAALLWTSVKQAFVCYTFRVQRQYTQATTITVHTLGQKIYLLLITVHTV